MNGFAEDQNALKSNVGLCGELTKIQKKFEGFSIRKRQHC